jgi:nucleotide-binding universal stress UspA family protein
MKPSESCRTRAAEWSNEIVVGLDGSPSSFAALQWAARYARLTFTDLRAIYVFGGSLGSAIAWSTGFPALEDLLDARPDIARKRTVDTMFEAVHPESDWLLEDREGFPGAVLVSESRNAQLLVVGTRQRNGLTRMLTGSTSHYCLDHAMSPVLAVQPPPPNRTISAAHRSPSKKRNGRRNGGTFGAAPPQQGTARGWDDLSPGFLTWSRAFFGER